MNTLTTITPDRSAFITGYAEALIWSDCDDDVSALHAEGLDALDAEATAEVIADCHAFIDENRDDLIRAIVRNGDYSWASAGHDFALTRNGHGAGFWDRGLGAVGNRLSDACRPYGESCLFWVDENVLGLT